MVSKKSWDKMKGIMFIVLGVFLVGAFLYGFSFLDTQIVGRVVFDLNADYAEGEALDGVLSLSIKKGELVPASSVVVFETAGERYEYALSDVVSGQVVDGNFYIEGVDVSGEGEGYGVKGEREVYPSVSFVLDILQEEESVPSEAPEEEAPESLVGNESSETEVVVEENVSEEVVVEENVSVEEVSEEEVVEEEVVEEVVIEEEVVEEVVEEVIEEEVVEEEVVETLPITGEVSLEFETKVDGEVSFDDAFSYNLQEGESAQIKKGSVKVGSTKLSEDVLTLDISDGVVSVTTSYSEVEQGFGEDFLDGEGSSLDINLSALGLLFGQGDLKVSLIYGEEEIVSLSVVLAEGVVESEEVVEEVEDNVTVVSTEPKNLTEIQITALRIEFGEVLVETTKSELVGDRLVIRYELGQYWVEYSYDYEDENLEALVERERIAWLSDLADTLVGEGVDLENVVEFGGDYEFGNVGNITNSS